MTTIQKLTADLLAGDLTAAVPLLDALEESRDFRRVTLNRLFGRLMIDRENAHARFLAEVEEGRDARWAEDDRHSSLRGAWQRFHLELRAAFWVVVELDMAAVRDAAADFKRAEDAADDDEEMPF